MSLQIALPGKQLRGIPEDMALDSESDSLKMPIDTQNPYFGQILVTFKTNPAVGTYPLFSFRHKFNYRPLYFVYFDPTTSSKELASFFNASMEFDNDADANQYFKVEDRADGFDFNFVVVSQFYDMTDNYFSFRYFVYANDGTP